MAVGGWRLVVGGGWRLEWWRLAVDGGWQLVVGGWRSLRAVLRKTKTSGSLKDPTASGVGALPGLHRTPATTSSIVAERRARAPRSAPSPLHTVSQTVQLHPVAINRRRLRANRRRLHANRRRLHANRRQFSVKRHHRYPHPLLDQHAKEVPQGRHCPWPTNVARTWPHSHPRSPVGAWRALARRSASPPSSRSPKHMGAAAWRNLSQRVLNHFRGCRGGWGWTPLPPSEGAPPPRPALLGPRFIDPNPRG